MTGATTSRALRLPAVSLSYGVPDLLRSEGHVDMTHPQVADCVDDSVLDGRRGADRPGFTYALGAERVVRGRRDGVVGLEPGELVCRRHPVVEQAGGQRDGIAVVDDLLEQRLPGTLRDAAMDLALDQHRIDLAPAVVHRDVP